MEAYKKLLKKYDDFYRRYLSLTQDTWVVYTRFYPFVVDQVMGYFSHPVFGPVLRRLFRFEGGDHHAEACIVPIQQNLEFCATSKRDGARSFYKLPKRRWRRVYSSRAA